MAKVRLSIVLEEGHLPKFNEVVRSLKKAGMTVENQLQSTGIVTGSVDEKKIKQLQKVNGVAQIEREHSLQIAPPDSDVQ